VRPFISAVRVSSECSHLPSRRQGTAAAAHLHTCFSKTCSSTFPCIPLQQGIHTCASTHAHTLTRTHTYTHAHVHTSARARTQTYTCTYTHAAQTARDGLRQLLRVASDTISKGHVVLVCLDEDDARKFAWTGPLGNAGHACLECSWGAQFKALSARCRCLLQTVLKQCSLWHSARTCPVLSR